ISRDQRAIDVDVKRLGREVVKHGVVIPDIAGDHWNGQWKASRNNLQAAIGEYVESAYKLKERAAHSGELPCGRDGTARQAHIRLHRDNRVGRIRYRGVVGTSLSFCHGRINQNSLRTLRDDCGLDSNGG